MTTQAVADYEITTEDIEYLRHGAKPLLARVHQPRGTGPFPLIVDLHGGAWCRGDRTEDKGINEPLARSGVVVVALDFRMPPDASYPGSVADIHYALRWCKARANELGSRPNMVGSMGISSGGHQAMLLAMRPTDPRYAVLPLPASNKVDATVRCAVLCWPVINPLGRYQYAKRLKAGGKPYPDLVDRVLPDHDSYWQNEENMAEGSPVLALERGEKVMTPPVLYLQGTADQAHPRADLDRFVAAYRKAGGQVQLELFDGVGEAFTKKDPNSSASLAAIEKIIEFVHREIQ
jgi:acetyl esterase/lipase